jgi:glycosyltransferase involved in cell wall biosynthesis
MRVGWLMDPAAYMGGAEHTQAEFRNAAPDGVEIVDCPPGEVDTDCDRFVIHNCVTYTLGDLEATAGRPAVKYWHDVGPHILPEVWGWLDKHTVRVCCSPVQADYMQVAARTIPPPVDLDRFRDAADRVNGSRRGVVSAGSWRNFGKAPHRAAEWAAAAGGGIDFYGDGPFAPDGCRSVAYDAMPGTLAAYDTFVYLPTVIEPFGRVVAEAWAAGCRIVTNRLVGAKWWIEHKPDALETAADDFWDLVLA